MISLRIYSVFLAMFLVLASCADGNEESAILQKTKSYEEIYNKGDAKALSLLWAEDAEYVIPDTGEIIKGRAAIQKQFETEFQDQKNAHITLKTYSVAFPKENQAIELGTAIVTADGKEVDKTSYRALYEKQNGDWLLKNVQETDFVETPIVEAPKQYEHLKGLEWLVGKWESEDPDSKIKSDWTWDRHKNFLIQQFSVDIEGKVELEGKQLVAWNPRTKEINSWLFDSDGGFAQGVWKKKGDSFVVESSHTMPDGKLASSINIYTPIDKDSFTWKSVGREIDGALMPDLEPVTLKRKG